MARRKSRYSGIGGQAVLEGVMMKNKEKYAVAVRKPDGEIEVEVETYQGLAHGSKFKELPFIRGIFNFLDSLILGTRALNYSASFYEEEEGKETKFDKAMDKMSGGNGEKLLSGIVTVISIMLAVGIFIVLPYFISSLFDSFIRNRSLMAIIEGVIRIALFLLCMGHQRHEGYPQAVPVSWGGAQMHQLYREGQTPYGAQCDAQLQTAQTLRHQLHFLCYAGKYCAVLLYPGG